MAANGWRGGSVVHRGVIGAQNMLYPVINRIWRKERRNAAW